MGEPVEIDSLPVKFFILLMTVPMRLDERRLAYKADRFLNSRPQALMHATTALPACEISTSTHVGYAALQGVPLEDRERHLSLSSVMYCGSHEVASTGLSTGAPINASGTIHFLVGPWGAVGAGSPTTGA